MSVLGSGSGMTQRRVLGSRYGPSAVLSEGVHPKKSLQWTRGLVNRGKTLLVTFKKVRTSCVIQVNWSGIYRKKWGPLGKQGIGFGG